MVRKFPLRGVGFFLSLWFGHPNLLMVDFYSWMLRRQQPLGKETAAGTDFCGRAKLL
jgi:hypothetical protein